MRHVLMDNQRIVELQPGSIDLSLAPVSAVRQQGILKAELFAQFQTRIASLSLETTYSVVGLNADRTKQRKQQGATSYIVTRQATVDQRNSMLTLAIVHPVLRWKFRVLRTLDRAKRNLLEIPPVFHGCGKRNPIAHMLVLIENLRGEIHARQIVIDSNSCGKRIFAEPMGDLKLGEHRPVSNYSRGATGFVTELCQAALRRHHRHL